MKQIILIFLAFCLLLPAAAQVGPPSGCNVLSFYGGDENYNIQFLTKDLQVFSPPTGFLNGRLTKGFDLLAPSCFTKDLNYLVMKYCNWDRQMQLEEELETVRQKLPSLIMEGEGTGRDDLEQSRWIDKFYELEEELSYARDEQLIIYDGEFHYVYSAESLVLEGISPDNTHLLFTEGAGSLKTFRLLNVADEKQKRLFSRSISGSYRADWVDNNRSAVSFTRSGKAVILLADREKTITEEIIVTQPVTSLGPLSGEGDYICFADKQICGFYNLHSREYTPLPGKTVIQPGYGIQWNPGGTTFAFVTREQTDSSVFIYLPGTGQLKLVQKGITDDFYTYIAGWLGNTQLVYGIYSWMGSNEPEIPTGLQLYNLSESKLQHIYKDRAEDYPPMACPFLDIRINGLYRRIGEVLPGRMFRAKEGSDLIALSPDMVEDGRLQIRISEELAETSYLDKIALVCNGREMSTEQLPAGLARLDRQYLILHRDEVLELSFPVPADFSTLQLYCAGYYEPEYLH